MIRSISQLQEYLQKEAKDYDDPAHKKRFLMGSPGCSLEKLTILNNKLPGVPQSYKKWISEFELNKVTIGYFILSPNPYGTIDIVEALIQANLNDSFLPTEFLEQKKLIWIGSNNDYTLYVAMNSSIFQEGEIILIDACVLVDIDSPQDCNVQRLAKDFEQFLIVAGNLNKTHLEINQDNNNWGEKEKEFLGRLKILDVAEEYHKAWLSVFYGV